jgi:hypothetical protein
MKFSKTTGCFYPEDIQYPNPPTDLIAVTADDYSAAMNRAAGETLDVQEGKLVIVPAPAPDPVAVLAAAKTNALGSIAAFAKSQRTTIAGTSDDAEIAGWSSKLRIAQAIAEDTASGVEKAAFQAEINARGIQGETLDIFCHKVMKNAGTFAQAVGLIDGLKRKWQDAVAAAKTPEEVAAVLDGMKPQAEAAFAPSMPATH